MSLTGGLECFNETKLHTTGKAAGKFYPLAVLVLNSYLYSIHLSLLIELHNIVSLLSVVWLQYKVTLLQRLNLFFVDVISAGKQENYHHSQYLRPLAYN